MTRFNEKSETFICSSCQIEFFKELSLGCNVILVEVSPKATREEYNYCLNCYSKRPYSVTPKLSLKIENKDCID